MLLSLWFLIVTVVIAFIFVLITIIILKITIIVIINIVITIDIIIRHLFTGQLGLVFRILLVILKARMTGF